MIRMLWIGLWLFGLGCGSTNAAVAAPAPKNNQAAEKPGNETVNLSLRLNSPEKILAGTVPFQALGNWSRPVVASLKKYGNELEQPFFWEVRIVFYPDRQPGVAFLGSPAPTQEQKAELQALLDLENAPKARFVAASLSFIIASPGAAELQKIPVANDEIMIPGFKSASHKERVAMLRDWARNGVLPLIAQICHGTDAKLEAVHAYADLLDQALKTDPIDVALFDRNEAYWQSQVQMGKGRALTATGRIFLDIANGHFDGADRMAFLLEPLVAASTPSAYFLKIFRRFFRVLTQGLQEELEKAVASYDAGDYQNAERVLVALLEEYAHNSQAWHELALVYMKTEDGAYQKTQAKVFESDPLCPNQVTASSAKEGYQTFRRLRMNELFKNNDPKQVLADYMTQIRIALDLEYPEIAATLACQVMQVDPTRQIEARDLFLYSLEKLGVSGLKRNYEGDFQAIFAGIDAERQKAMEEDPVYQSFAK